MNDFDLTTFDGAVAFARYYASLTIDLLPSRDGYHFKGPNDLLLRAGSPMLPRPKPTRVPWGVPRYCYQNCHKLVARSRRWLYAEGWAVCPELPFPLPHAWVVDARTGTAHEITMRTPPAAFLGVAFTPAYSRARFREQCSTCGDCCGPLIDAWEERWPLLRLPPDELAAVLVPAPAEL